MKKFLISAALLVATSTAAFADASGGNGGMAAAGAGAIASNISATLMSANRVNQSAVAMPLNTTDFTVRGGAGTTTSTFTSNVNQTANAMNVFSSALSSAILY